MFVLASCGQILDKSDLARDVGISPKTANAWLSVLAASNQIALLEPWFANVGKRLVKAPKLYFTDTGLCAFLLGVTGGSLGSSPYLGALWETLIYGEIRRALMLHRRPLSIWFYRDHRQLEVDFLLTGGGHGDVVEVKWTELPDGRDARGVRELMTTAKERGLKELGTSRGFVICRPAETYPIGGDGPRVDAVSIDQFVARLLAGGP